MGEGIRGGRREEGWGVLGREGWRRGRRWEAKGGGVGGAILQPPRLLQEGPDILNVDFYVVKISVMAKN